jgi:integrase
VDPGEYRRWRERDFAPAVERAGIELGRPYDLRHGCASLLLHAGWPLDRISKHMGHTIATLSAYYSHLIEDLRDQDPVDVEQQITPPPADDARALRLVRRAPQVVRVPRRA